MEGFISDEEMSALDPQGSVKPEGFLTDDEMKAQEEALTPSKVESGLRGFAQGAGMGFADELTGALESTAGSLGIVPDKTYEQARDESRAAYHAAEEANPGSYNTGQFAGGLSTLAVPGLGAVKGAGALKAVGTAALQGGATGLGFSEAEDLSGMAKDAGKGALVGGLIGGIAPAAGGVLDKVAPKAASTISGATSYVKDKVKPLLDRAGDIAETGAGIYGLTTGDWSPTAVISGTRRLGGGAAMRVVDKGLEKLPELLKASPEVFGKYAKPLMTAMSRGGSSLGAAHFVLQNNDPEYRKMLSEMRENE